MELTTSFLMCKEWHGEAQNKHYFQFSLPLCSIWQIAHIQIVFLLINQTSGYLSSLPIGQTTMWDGGLWYGVLIIKPWQIAASVYLQSNRFGCAQWTCKVCWPWNATVFACLSNITVPWRLIYIYISNDHINVIFNLCQYVCVVHMSQMGGGRGHKSLEQAVSAHWASLLASTLNWITLVWETCGCNIWCWGNKRLRN